MPPARSATAPKRKPLQARPRSKPRRVTRRSAISRVRWDRLGRIALLLTLIVVAGVYVQDILNYFSTRAQADQQHSIVQRLTRENAQLVAEQNQLNDPNWIVRDARALGMVRSGERPYVMTGLPSH